MIHRAYEVAALTKAARLRIGLSQAELGKVLGVIGQTVSNVERGYQTYSVKQLINISKVLRIPFEDLKRAWLKDYETAFNKHVDILTSFTELRKTDEAGERVL